MAWLLFGIAVVLAAGPLAGQEGEPPVFSAGTEAVLLDMVVRDEEGRLVPDLSADEIQIYEDGRLCEISSFRLVRAEDAGGAESDLASPRGAPPTPFDRSPGSPGRARQGIQPAAEGARSVSVEDESLRQPGGGGERLGSVVLLVFDHLGFESAPRARDAALDMIDRPFPAGTWFAVIKVGTEFSLLQPFTEDRSSLAAPIERATTGAERAGPAPLNPGYASAAEEALALAFAADQLDAQGAGSGADPLQRAAAALAAFNARNEGTRRGQETLYPLLALSRSLRTVRGRKTMLYFSEGLPVPQGLHEVFWSAISDANRSNLTVYGFDARGLSVDSHGAAAGSVSRDASTTAASRWNETRALLNSVTGPGVGDERIALDALTANRQLNLQNLSEGTGGFLVANTNDLRPGLERVAADLRAYYEVAYVTPKPAPDGTWREIEVKVTRPGAKVRARKGYFALSPGAPVVRPSELPLMAALEEQPRPRDVPLRAAAVSLAGVGEERDVLVALEVPVSAATFEARPGEAGDSRAHARLSFLAMVRDAEGRLVARMSHDTSLEGSELEVVAMRAQSLVVKRALSLVPGRYSLEAAALDRGSSRAGARRVAFEVPGGTGLSLGSLTVVRPEPLPEGSDELLRAGDVRGTPRFGEPVVAAEGEVVAVFLSLQPGESPEPPELTLEMRRDGQVVSRSDAELPPPDAKGRVAYLGQFPAEILAPGRYVLHARARQGTAEATVATSFRVVASEPDAPAPATAGVIPPDAPDPPDVPSDVAPILEVAGRYVVEFQESFRNIVAEETYRQWRGSETRKLRSDIVFVTLPGDVPWVTFRDVFEVSGKLVRDRDARLEALFANPDAATWERAEAIRRESARFNLGTVYRTINVPTLALVTLHPRFQGRFRWEKKGQRKFHGRTGIELQAVEVVRPTLVRELDGADVLSQVKVWIEAETGRVLRTEAHYRIFERDLDADAWIETQYRPEPSVASWVPESMEERYRSGRSGFGLEVTARAEYANHRRFQVDTSEGRVRLTGEEPPLPVE